MKKLILLLTLTLLPTTAFAQLQSQISNAESDSGETEKTALDDACYNLDENREWYELFLKFTQAFQNENYDEALSYTAQLKTICSDSPILNYSIGMTYLKKYDTQTALSYLELATKNTKEFQLSADMTKKILFALYEAENANDNIKKEQCNKKLSSLSTQLTQQYQEQTKKLELSLLEQKRHDDFALLWTGAGIGIAGLVVTATGAALLATADGLTYSQNSDKSITINNIKPRYTGYALLGVGITATVIGAVTAGVGGYRYSKSFDNEKSLSLHIAPQSLNLSVTF